MPGNAELYQIFQAALESEKTVRQQAELTLDRLLHEEQDFVVQLLRFSTQPTTEAPDPITARKVFLAAAIRIKNVLGRSDWNRSDLPEQVKETVKEIIVPLQCAAHVEEHIRRQLLSTTSELLQYDYPERWPQVVPQVSQIVETCMMSFSTMSGSHEMDSQAMVTLLLQLKGALGVLRYCCKIYHDPLKGTDQEVNEFASVIIPSMLTLWDLLVRRWEDEARNLFDAEQKRMSNPERNVFELSPLLTELSHCLRICSKCLWSLCANRWPKVLCEEGVFLHFFSSCLRRPTEVLTNILFPVFKQRIVRDVEQSNWYGDRFNEFQEASVWRLAKWCGTFMHKIIQEFSFPKQCEKRARNAAKIFAAEFLQYTAAYSLEMVRWHSSPVSLNSKAYIMALETLTLVVIEPMCYTNVLLPVVEELMTSLLFPRFAFSSDDAELWNMNPEEYVRKQTSPVGDLFSPKVVSASLLLSLAVPTKSFHDTSLATNLVEFSVNQLANFSEQASQTTPGEPASPSMEAARRVDAALYCLFQLTKVVKRSEAMRRGMEEVLIRYVVPATTYPIGFLRARAVQVLSVYSKVVAWSSPQNFQQTLLAVIPLLQDGETPVRVQTCVSFSLLIHHPHAWEVVNPCIAEVVQQYFTVMRMIDNEAVVRTLQKTIRIYSSSLCQWAVELTEMITQHFFKVAETVTGKYISFESTPSSTEMFAEDDNFVDVLMTADELLETLTILIKSIPRSAFPGQGVPAESETQHNSNTVMLLIQERVAPVLQTILSYQSGSAYGFMDPALRLLTTLLSHSPSIVPHVWRLLPCLYQLVANGAADYFGQMLAPLDNYSSVEPMHFLLSPLGVLCPGDCAYFSPGDMMQWTPAQLVLSMGELVYSSSTLRWREKSSVPKVCDAFLQNYWWAATQQSSGVASPTATTTADAVCTAALTRLATLAPPSTSMKVLLANNVFSAVLADAKGASLALSRLNMLPGFFQEYVALVSQPSVLEVLRGCDRRLVVAAVAEGIRAVQESRASAQEWTDALAQLEAALCAVAESQLLQRFAERDAAEVSKETEELRQHLRKVKRGEEAEWESEDDEWGSDEESEDESEAEDFGGDELPSDEDNGKLNRLIAEAQSARQLHGEPDGGAERNVDEMEDDLLDEDDMESPILDKINVWMALMEVALEGREISPAAAAFVDTRFQAQWLAITQAKESLRAWNEVQVE